MEFPTGLQPDDRVLIVGIPDPGVVSDIARRLTRGLLVTIGGDDDVRAARKAARHLDNVMFVPGSPDELPWRDGFFTVAIDTVGHWPDGEKVAKEIARVTAPRAPEV